MHGLTGEILMTVRAFPPTREEPKKRLLLIPVVLIFGGMGLTMLHPALRLIGSIIALTGVLSVFLVGMVVADLWAASRRTRSLARERDVGAVLSAEGVETDPFEDAVGERPSDE